MSDISTVPSVKQYRFSNCSYSCICVLTVFIVCLLLPFFMVYSVDGFYLRSSPVFSQPALTFTSKYYIGAATTSSYASSSNLIAPMASSSFLFTNIQVSEQDIDGDRKPDLFIFEAELLKSTLNVVKIDAVLLFKIKTEYVSAPVMVRVGFQGNSIAYARALGTIQMFLNENMNSTGNDYGDLNPFESQLYDIAAAYANYTQQPIYILPRVSKQVINDNTDKTFIKIQLNLEAMLRQPLAASIFEQFIWSWCQYLPVALMIGIVGYFGLVWCFEYDMLDARVSYRL